MKDKPAIQDVKEAVFEAKELAEIDSGGFKIVYNGLAKDRNGHRIRPSEMI